MTLPEVMDKENVIDTRRLKTLNVSLFSSLRQAVRRRGVTSGVTDCAELLQRDPHKIMMCILATNCGIAAHIHHTLIQAFCHENGIAIIYVDSSDKLEKLIDKLVKKMSCEEQSKHVADSDCLLIKFPEKNISKQDQLLLDFYRELTWKHYPMPTFSLPG